MFFNDASGFEEGYATKDNLKIYYRDYGPADGTPVLLVMGLGGQLTFWPPYMIKFLQQSGSVSYTHLTLPTNREV